MATLTLTRVFLNLASDGTLILSAWSADDPQVAYASGGEVTNAAGGRQRSVSVEGEAISWPITLRDVTLAQIETLRDYTRQVVQARDTRGQLHYGTYFELGQRGYKGVDRHDVSLELRVVTFPEGV